MSSCGSQGYLLHGLHGSAAPLKDCICLSKVYADELVYDALSEQSLTPAVRAIQDDRANAQLLDLQPGLG